MVPEGAKLYRDTNGNLKGVFYKDGKIVEHGKFREVGPSMFKAAKAVGTQVLLVSIAMQLNRIEEQVSKVFLEFHGDRIAEVDAGKSLFNQACSVKSKSKAEQLALQSITELTRGFEKTVGALGRQISELPEEKLSFFDNWGGNKSHMSQKAHQIASESFAACLQALQTIARCYIFLEERDAAFSIVKDGFRKIDNARVDVALLRARLAPRVNGSLPEAGWKRFIDNRSSFNGDTWKHILEPDNDSLRLELTPQELLEV